MTESLRSIVHQHIGKVKSYDVVQELWSGYGHIYRCYIEGNGATCIVKDIQLPASDQHPRGWNTNISHQRKLHSYQVEMNWYSAYAERCDKNCRIAKTIYCDPEDGRLLIIMEDLDHAGYNVRKHPMDMRKTDAFVCLRWLANFHAMFMNEPGSGLWPIGTYWHLDTRPDEWSKMQNRMLREAAQAIDNKLNECRYKTIVHGDAKLANFCFSNDGRVAAVDFQYVGRGCGMKDVAYFISSVFDEEQAEALEAALLNHYFGELERALEYYQPNIDTTLVVQEWREMYAYAWADFYRFLDGWSPGHWKMHRYSRRITDQVLNAINR